MVAGQLGSDLITEGSGHQARDRRHPPDQILGEEAGLMVGACREVNSYMSHVLSSVGTAVVTACMAATPLLIDRVQTHLHGGGGGIPAKGIQNLQRHEVGKTDKAARSLLPVYDKHIQTSPLRHLTLKLAVT